MNFSPIPTIFPAFLSLALIFSYNFMVLESESTRGPHTGSRSDAIELAAADISEPPYSRTHRLPIEHSRATPPEDYVLSAAEIPEENWKAGHRGVDLNARPGDAIYASRGGTVYFAGVVAGTPVVSILHSDGLRTTYEPVLRTVSKGDPVRRGELIGHLADAEALPETARTSPGLSWGARDGDVYVDPMTLLGHPVIRLKE